MVVCLLGVCVCVCGRPLPDNKQDKDVNTPGGIRTLDPSKRETADLRLKPCGHRGRRLVCVYWNLLFRVCHSLVICFFLVLCNYCLEFGLLATALLLLLLVFFCSGCTVQYRRAGNSLARPGRKQANVSVRMVWISFGALPCRKINLMAARISILLKSRASLTYFRICFLPGRAKDLSAPR